MARTRNLLTDDGDPIVAGSTIVFSYGAPPVVVEAQVVARNGELVAVTPGHDPAEAPVSTILPFFEVQLKK